MSAGSQGGGESALTAPRHPTRQAVLVAHTEAVIHEMGVERTEIACEIAREYHDRVAADHRSLPLEPEPQINDVDAYLRWFERTRKTIERMMTGATRLPVEIEDAWVAALPDPYRARCIQALTERMGHLAVELSDESASVGHLGRVLKEAGEEHVAAAAVYADGRVDENDLQALLDAEREARESAAASLAHADKMRRAYEELSQCGGDDDGDSYGQPLEVVS